VATGGNVVLFDMPAKTFMALQAVNMRHTYTAAVNITSELCNFVMCNWNTCPYLMDSLQLLGTASGNTGRCGHSSTHDKNFCPTFRTIMQNAEGSKY
jgi:hypothetical protein